jgi:type VI secretion system protein ImpJ
MSVTSTPNGVPDTRYSAETQSVADFNLGNEEKEVQVARKNFRVLLGSESRVGFSSLRIAQVIRTAKNTYELKRSHIAPCLDIGHSKYLLGMLQTLVGVLSNKSDSLSAGRRERGKSLADFTASETSNFWLLHTINSSLPELRHIWNVRHGHPEQAYLAMTRLTGALATFSLEASLDNLPDYDHLDLGGCFEKLETQIRALVETVIVEAYVTIPLVMDRDIWKGTIPDDRYFEDSQFFLAVSSANETGELIQKVPLRIRAAAPDQIDRLIKNALAGINLIHTPAPPAIRMKLGNQYFALSQSGDLWQQVKNSRSIAIFTPADIKQPKLELIVLKNKRS